MFPCDIGQCEIVDISVSDVQKLAEIAMGKQGGYDEYQNWEKTVTR